MNLQVLESGIPHSNPNPKLYVPNGKAPPAADTSTIGTLTGGRGEGGRGLYFLKQAFLVLIIGIQAPYPPTPLRVLIIQPDGASQTPKAYYRGLINQNCCGGSLL